MARIKSQERHCRPNNNCRASPFQAGESVSTTNSGAYCFQNTPMEARSCRDNQLDMSARCNGRRTNIRPSVAHLRMIQDRLGSDGFYSAHSCLLHDRVEIGHLRCPLVCPLVHLRSPVVTWCDRLMYCQNIVEGVCDVSVSLGQCPTQAERTCVEV